MDKKQVLNRAADLLEKVATALVAREAQVAELHKKASATSELVKKANDSRASAAGLAKTAASAALDAGVVRDQKAADELAVRLLDHTTALEELAKVASLIEAPSVGRNSQIKHASASKTELSADDVWNQHVASVNSGSY